ncbi:hypothetical protein BDN72DRAFT_50918 [Pluteus cervinus]|uniref:Uncharacterized protein n=1 Tax=Pluteus cervinus TaxID=181527 RepID=A0ACD3B8Q3_9AGAR|nr:hypothetical protein BDN72DRAFT_50918 [Pluteus cervinus]
MSYSTLLLHPSPHLSMAHQLESPELHNYESWPTDFESWPNQLGSGSTSTPWDNPQSIPSGSSALLDLVNPLTGADEEAHPDPADVSGRSSGQVQQKIEIHASGSATSELVPSLPFHPAFPICFIPEFSSDLDVELTHNNLRYIQPGRHQTQDHAGPSSARPARPRRHITHTRKILALPSRSRAPRRARDEDVPPSPIRLSRLYIRLPARKGLIPASAPSPPAWTSTTLNEDSGLSDGSTSQFPRAKGRRVARLRAEEIEAALEVNVAPSVVDEHSRDDPEVAAHALDMNIQFLRNRAGGAPRSQGSTAVAYRTPTELFAASLVDAFGPGDVTRGGGHRPKPLNEPGVLASEPGEVEEIEQTEPEEEM